MAKSEVKVKSCSEAIRQDEIGKVLLKTASKRYDPYIISVSQDGKNL